MLRVAVAGHGVARRLHAPVLSCFRDIQVIPLRLPHVESPRRRTPMDEEDIRSLDLDLLIVGTPPVAHVAHTELAVSASVPVLCEKPAGMDTAGARAIMNLRDESRMPVAVNYQLRFSAVVEDLRGLMPDHPRRILITYTADAAIQSASRSDWRRSTNSGGGMAYAVGSHLIELLYFIGVRPASVIERAAGLTLFHVSGESADGGEWEVFADGRRQRAEFTIRIELPSAILTVDMIDGSIKEGHGRTQARLTYPVSRLRSNEPSPWRAAFERCVREIIGAGAISLSKCATVEDALKVHSVLEGAAATRRTRTPVEIPQ